MTTPCRSEAAWLHTTGNWWVFAARLYLPPPINTPSRPHRTPRKPQSPSPDHRTHINVNQSNGCYGEYSGYANRNLLSRPESGGAHPATLPPHNGFLHRDIVSLGHGPCGGRQVRNAMANDTLKKIRAAYDTVTECPKWDDR